jgi:hypothetical protein
MEVIKRNGVTVYIDPDPDTCERFDRVLLGGVQGFQSVDSIPRGRASESQPQQQEEPPQPQEPS